MVERFLNGAVALIKKMLQINWYRSLSIQLRLFLPFFFRQVNVTHTQWPSNRDPFDAGVSTLDNNNMRQDNCCSCWLCCQFCVRLCGTRFRAFANNRLFGVNIYHRSSVPAVYEFNTIKTAAILSLKWKLFYSCDLFSILISLGSLLWMAYKKNGVQKIL